MGIAKDDFNRVRTPYQNADRQLAHFTSYIIYLYLTNSSLRWKRIFAKAIFRPFALFAREPIIQLLGVYMAFVYLPSFLPINIFR